MNISAVSCDVGADRSVFDMKISTGSHTKHVINTTAVFSCKNFGRDANQTFFSTRLACIILGHLFIMNMNSNPSQLNILFFLGIIDRRLN